MDDFIILLAFFGVFVISTSFIYSKLVLAQINNPIHMLFLQITINYILLLIIFVPSLLLFGEELSQNLNIPNILVIFCSAMAIFAALLSFYIGLERGNVTVGGMIISSRVIVSVFLAWLFFSENIPVISYLFILIVFGSVLMVSWEKELPMKEILLFKSSGTSWYLLSVIFFSTGNVFIRLLNNQVNILTQLVLRLTFLLFVIILFYPMLNQRFGDKRPLKETVSNPKLLIQALIFVFLILIADFATSIAIGESLTITETIGALEGIFIFIMMLVILQNKNLRTIFQEPFDRKTITIRFLGVILATLGILGFISTLN